jgi:hypothetical protein
MAKWAELQRLERRERMLEERLPALECQETRAWRAVKAYIRAVFDDLPRGIARWIERLDANYELRFPEPRNEPAAVPVLSRSGSSRPKR